MMMMMMMVKTHWWIWSAVCPRDLNGTGNGSVPVASSRSLTRLEPNINLEGNKEITSSRRTDWLTSIWLRYFRQIFWLTSRLDVAFFPQSNHQRSDSQKKKMALVKTFWLSQFNWVDQEEMAVEISSIWFVFLTSIGLKLLMSRL